MPPNIGALEPHRLAGMCRSPESRERHLRREQELLRLANNEECLHGYVHRSRRASRGHPDSEGGSLSPPALSERCNRRLARRLVAVRRKHWSVPMGST